MDEVLENFSRQLWTVDSGLFRFFWLQWKSSAGKTGSVSIVTTKVIGKPRKNTDPNRSGTNTPENDDTLENFPNLHCSFFW